MLKDPRAAEVVLTSPRRAARIVDDAIPETLAPLPIVEDRSQEQLEVDGDDDASIAKRMKGGA